MFRHGIADPRIRAVVGDRKLFDSERLADAPPELVGHDFELGVQPLSGDRIAQRSFETAVPVFPFVPDCFDHHGHGRRTYPLVSRANGGPRRIELAEDVFPEHVAGSCEREGDVRVQTFEGARTGPGASDAEVELRSQLTLLGVSAVETRAQGWILGSRSRPPLDTARCLQPRDGRH